MDVVDIGRQFMRHHQRLPEPANPVRGPVAPQIAEPGPESGTIGRQFPHGPPGPENAARFLIKVFGQVTDRRSDFVMHGMGTAIGRMTQGNDFNIHPPPLQATDFLRNESFRQARISFQDDGCLTGHPIACPVSRVRQPRR